MMKYRQLCFIMERVAPIFQSYRNFDILKSMIKEAHKNLSKSMRGSSQFHDQCKSKKSIPMHR